MTLEHQENNQIRLEVANDKGDNNSEFTAQELEVIEKLQQDFDVEVVRSNKQANKNWKLSGGKLDHSIYIEDLSDAYDLVSKGFYLKTAKHVNRIIRTLGRGRSKGNVTSVVSGGDGPVLVIDGGDDLAVSLENSGLPKKLVYAVQASALYPGFIAVVHKGWLGALEERNEKSEEFDELKQTIDSLQDELKNTLKAELTAHNQITEPADYGNKLESLVSQIQFKKYLFEQFKDLNFVDEDVQSVIERMNKLTDDVANHRNQIEQSLATNSTTDDPVLNQLFEDLDSASLFDPNSSETHDLIEKIAEVKTAQEEKWLKFIDSKVAGAFTESGLGSMYWGMMAFQSRATIQLLETQGLTSFAEMIGNMGDVLNVVGQSQMVVAGIAKAGIGIHETHSLSEWLKMLKESPLQDSTPEFTKVQGMLESFESSKRNAMILDVFGNIVLSAGQLGMILGGPFGVGISAVLFAGVSATIGGVGFTQAVAQYMNKKFAIIEEPSAREKSILSDSGGTEDTIKKTLLDRIEKLYQFSEQQAPARVWQKIYKQVIKKPHYTSERIIERLKKQFSKETQSYHQSYQKALEQIEKNPALIEQALQSVKKKTPEGQWDLLLQMGGHLRALKSGDSYEHTSDNHGQKVRTLFDVAESLGFGKELERRFVKELVNNPNYYQRNKLVISDYVKEVNIVKSKQPWNIPNPLRPIFHVVDFVRGADANPIEPLFKISWGHKKTKILKFDKVKLLNDLENNSSLTAEMKTILDNVFLHKGVLNYVGHDKRSVFLAALDGLGKQILRSDVIRPIMVGAKSQIELGELLRPAIEAQQSSPNRLGVTESQLADAFLLTAHHSLESGIEFASNQKKLTVLPKLSTDLDPDVQERANFRQSIGEVEVNQGEHFSGKGVSRLVTQIRKTKQAENIQLYRLSVGDKHFSIVKDNQHITLYQAKTGATYLMPKISSLRETLTDLGAGKQHWQLTAVDVPENQLLGDVATKLSKPFSPEWQSLLEADSQLGKLTINDLSLSRLDLWLLGLTDINSDVRLSAKEIASIGNMNTDKHYGLDAEMVDSWLKSGNEEQSNRALLMLDKIKLSSGEQLQLIGSSDLLARLTTRIENIRLLESTDASLSALSEDLDVTLKTLARVNEHSDGLYGDPSVHSTPMKRLAVGISRANMGLMLSRLPGSLYQIGNSIHNGQSYDALKEGVGMTTDLLDISLDLLANSQKIQSLSSKFSNVAGKLGAVMNFVGAGVGIWYATDAFTAAAKTSGAERTDNIVAGSLAVAGTLVSVATGIASLVTATAGPIGAAIGLAIGVAQGIYNAVRMTNDLRAAGISEGEIWRAGAAVFFGFPVPESIQNQAAYNRAFESYQAQKEKSLEALHAVGFDKIVYSKPYIDTLYGKAKIKERNDFYNLSPEQMEQYKDYIPDQDPGMIFGNQPEHALSVSKNEQNQKGEGRTLFMLGNGYDAAQGDMDRSNLFKIDGWGRKQLFGGAKNDIFEVVHWRTGPKYRNDKPSILKGGEGEDTLSLRSTYSHHQDSGETQGAYVDLSLGNARASHLNHIEISGIEHVIGSMRDDKFIGNDEINHFIGYEGSDYLRGHKGNDTLAGGRGTDILRGDQGSDSYIIQTDDFLSDESVDTIQNFDDHFQKNWQEKYDYFYDLGISYRTKGYAYTSADWQDTLKRQAKRHADHWTKQKQGQLGIPEYPAQDSLITNLDTVSAGREGDDLLLSVNSQWLVYQQLVKSLKELDLQNVSNEAENQLVTKVQQLMSSYGITKLYSTGELNDLLAIVRKNNSNLSTSIELRELLQQVPEQASSATTVTRVEDYFVGRAYQHLSLVDMLGNQYSFETEADDQGKVSISSMQLSSQMGEAILVDLEHHILKAETGLSQKLMSEDVDHVKGASSADTIFGNQNENWIHGGAGFDNLHGHDGDDVLIGGADGGRLAGGNGSDVYLVEGNESRLVIDTTSTDEARDTIRFTNGLEQLRYTKSAGNLKFQYFDTDIEVADLSREAESAFGVSVINQDNHKEGEMNFFADKGKLSLSSINLTSGVNVDYSVNLSRGVVSWEQDLKSIKPFLSEQSYVTTSSGNDLLVTGTGVNHLTAGLGNDTYQLGSQDVSLVLDNFATDGKVDTLMWTNIEIENISYSREGQSLVLINAANINQQVIIKDWFEGDDYQHLQLEDKNGDLCPITAPDLLVQAMSTFGFESEGTLDNNDDPRSAVLPVLSLPGANNIGMMG